MKLELYRQDTPHVYALFERRDHKAIIEYLQSRRAIYANAEQAQRGAYHYMLGTAFSKIGDYKEADFHFDKATGIAPWHHKIKLEIADSYLQRGALSDAETLLTELADDRGLEASGLNRRLHYITAKYLKLVGRYAAARQCYKDAEKLGGRYTNSSKDIALMDIFISQDADNTRGTMEYAYHLACLDEKEDPQTELALVFLRNCLNYFKRTNDRTQCLASLSQISMQFNHVSDAVKYNQQALELNPAHPRSLSARIRMLFEIGNAEEALIRYHEDADVIKQDPRATLALARALKYEGHAEPAHGLAKHLLKRDDITDDVRKNASTLLAVTNSMINRKDLFAQDCI